MTENQNNPLVMLANEFVNVRLEHEAVAAREKELKKQRDKLAADLCEQI